MTSAFEDLRLAFRGLLRAPGLLVSGVVCLSLGIGVTAAMLGVLDRLLLRPPAHVRDAGALRYLYFQEPRGGGPQDSVSFPMFTDLAGKVDAFSGLAACWWRDGSIGVGPEAQKAMLGFATPGFFPLLGVEPVRGRVFSETEGDPERPAPVALVSWELWQRSFSGTPDILGKPLRIERQVYTVVGVLPQRFTGLDLQPVDVWLPMGAVGMLGFGDGWSMGRSDFFLHIAGRLRPGVSARQAAEQATLAHRQAYSALGDRSAGGRSVLLGPVQWGRRPYGSPVARMVAWLTAAAAAVLCIACFNVASLLIVRGLERRRELAVRLALGASRSRLARLLLAEGVLLALLGGIAALGAARLVDALLRALLLPPGALSPGSLDGRFLAILSGLSLFAGLLSGLAAALWGSRQDLAGAARTGGTERTPGRSRLRAALLVAQVAFTCALLIGSGLFVRSLRNVQHLSLGLEAERVVVATTQLTSAGWKPEQIDAFYRQALERIRTLPGVEHAALAAGIPFRTSIGTWLSLPGRGYIDSPPGGIYFNSVAGDFFAALGTPLRRGRALTEQDATGAERVAVINETMARLVWPGQNPLGQCFYSLNEKTPCITVVGIVADARRGGLQEPPTIQFYIPLSQAPAGTVPQALFVRSTAGKDRLHPVLRRELAGIAPNLPFVDVRRLSDYVEPQLRPWRLGATLFSLFGLLGLALAVLGIFAAVAQAVTAREAELGIRVAMGARSRHLLWQVMRSGLSPVSLGIALGLALAVSGGQRIEPLLFQVSARDPEILTIAVLALLATAVLASLLPALRVRRLDPAAVMRTE